jgi:hypothetical protein
MFKENSLDLKKTYLKLAKLADCCSNNNPPSKPRTPNLQH